MVNFPVKKIFLTILLGTAASAVYLVQQEKLIKQHLHQKIHAAIEKSLDCKADFELTQINFLSPQIVCQSVEIKPVNPHDHGWNWNCPSIRCSWSWWALIAHKSLEITIEIDQINLRSKYQDGNLAIWPHLHKLIFTTSPIPILLNELHIKSGNLQLDNQFQTKTISLNWSSHTKEVGSLLKSNVYINGGQVPINSASNLQNLQGNWQINLPTKGHLEALEINGNGQFTLPEISADDRYFIKFNWANLQGTGQLKNETGNVDIDQVTLSLKNKALTSSLQGSFKLNLFNQILPNNINLSGQAKFTLHGQVGQNSQIIGSCDVQSCRINQAPVLNRFKTKFEFNSNNANWSGKGQIYLKTALKSSLEGAWTWQNQNIKLTGLINHQSKPVANYQAQFQKHAPYLKSLTIKNQAQQIVGQINQNQKDQDQLLATIWLDQLVQLLPAIITDQVVGKGQLKFTGQLIKQGLKCEYQLSSGQIVLNKIQTPIKRLSGSWVWNHLQKSLTINETTAWLHQGQIKIPQAKISYHGALLPIHMHIPIIFDQCAINLKSNLGTICSGHLLWKTNLSSPPHLHGLIILEQTRYLGNPWNWSTKLNDSTTAGATLPDPELSITILSRSPIQIQTEALKTQAHLQLQVLGQLSKPLFYGQLSAVSGQINLPYKPLIIESGVIYLNGNLKHIPILDLTASAQIKQFNLTLHTNGPINQIPPITFESNPPLSDEQIAALLLTGSENTSLNMLMPALIIQNLNFALFGSTETLANEHPLIKQLLKPFEHIKFIPSFSDETGRGGLRGIIEINVNDRLRASVQKNFSLSEDSQIEVDYALTDDISLRGIKDERGDLGGEIELKFRA